jgi:iron(III) transport system permease protein
MLVWFETLNDYGAVKYFGVKTYTSAIFKLWYGMGDLGSALIFSSALISLVVMIKVVISAFRVQSTLSEKNFAIYNKKKGLVLSAIAIVIPLISFVLPTLYAFLVYLSSSDSYLIDIDILYGSILNTGLFSFIGAFLIIVISVFIAYSIYHQKLDCRKTRINEILRKSADLSLSGYAVPGAVTALAVTMFFAEIDGAGIFFIIPLMLAYAIRYSMVGYSTIGSDIENNSGRYSLVGMSLGDSRIKSLFRSVLPNASKSIVAAFVLCFIEISKDLPLTLILRDYDTETLATSAYRYANDEQLVRSFPYGLLIIALGIISILISNKLSGEKH